jgi:predicted ATP-grasp superfamily ATP-dependent carboligase
MSKVPLDKAYLRHLFLKFKSFLLEVHNSKTRSSTAELIKKAPKFQANVLIRIIYLVVHEAIPIEKKLMRSLSQANKKRLVEFCKDHKKVSNYLSSKIPLNEKKAFLLKFVDWIPKILTPLFEHVEL